MSIINNHIIDQTADGKWFVVYPDNEKSDTLASYDDAIALVELD